ncbi:class F sortase [Gordonia sp. PKS22-38]|uniref:Class F sortase n=1 Tax=Gordonia prachuapensis TaxID=3115651 RepID=A0ABU7N060_9ACTN|nr:class F sortase [Gordonia sp. PKS22-38]
MPAADRQDAVPASEPTRLMIAPIGLDKQIRVLPESVCPTIDPPTLSDPYWLECRSQPGTDSPGTTFIAGHAVSGGDGVFNDLEDVAVGESVTVATRTGVLTYRVSSVRAYGRNGEIQSAPELREPIPGRLLLVTCRLDDAGLTDENLVVQADLVASSAGK